MAKFHTLFVKDVRKETEECVSVAFDIPNELKDEFRFIQGQYVTLKLNLEGEDLRRSYSICSSPVADTEFRIASKKVKDGKVSNYLFEKLKTGDKLEVMTPMGNFYSSLIPSLSKNYIMFAGGSGITPIFSIIKTVLKVEPGSKIILFYGNRDETSVIFKNQLIGLEKSSNGRLKIFQILERPIESHEEIFTGILTTEKIEELLKKHSEIKSVNEFFICGPLPMMNNVKATLEKFKIDKELIHIEYFTTVLEDIVKAEKTEAPHVLPYLNSKVTVILDGAETTFELNAKGKTILDAAIDQDLDVPFACKGAVCCTCKAKLLEGRVDMDMNYALTQSEVSSGYILTCQSHPTTEKVVISYDEI